MLHHHGSKERLLATVAQRLSATRRDRWFGALAEGGVGALDTLWERLLLEQGEGSARALLELRLAGTPGTLLTPADATALARAIARALDLPLEELPSSTVLEPILEGFLLALQRGAPSEEVREAFFRYWLSYLK